MGCPARDCQKGTVLVETKERCVLVSCPTCSGKGYITLWKMTDETRVKVSV